MRVQILLIAVFTLGLHPSEAYSWRSSCSGSTNNAIVQPDAHIEDFGQRAHRVVTRKPILAHPIISGKHGLVIIPTVEDGKVVAVRSDCSLGDVWEATLWWPIINAPVLDETEDLLFVSTVSPHGERKNSAIYVLNTTSGGVINKWRLPPSPTASLHTLVTSDLKQAGDHVVFAMSMGPTTWLAAVSIKDNLSASRKDVNVTIAWSCMTDSPVKQAIALVPNNETTAYALKNNGDLIEFTPGNATSKCSGDKTDGRLSSYMCSQCANRVTEQFVRGTVATAPLLTVGALPTWGRKEVAPHVVAVSMPHPSGLSSGIFALPMAAEGEAKLVYTLSTLALVTAPIVLYGARGPTIVAATDTGTLLGINASCLYTDGGPCTPMWYTNVLDDKDDSHAERVGITAGPISDGNIIMVGLSNGYLVAVSKDGQPGGRFHPAGLRSSIHHLLFLASGSILAISEEHIYLHDGTCPRSSREVLYIAVATLGCTAASGILVYYCIKAANQRAILSKPRPPFQYQAMNESRSLSHGVTQPRMRRRGQAEDPGLQLADLPAPPVPPQELGTTGVS